jgi:hypothetical protein
VTYVPGRPERLLAYVVVSGPIQSDIRQATVVRDGASILLDGWEYLV